MQIQFCFIFPSAQSIILPSAAADLGESWDSLVRVQRLCVYAHTRTHTPITTVTRLKCPNAEYTREQIQILCMV